MSFLIILKRATNLFIWSIEGAVNRIRYDNWTISAYFRKQGAHIGEGCRLDIRYLSYYPELVSIGNHVFIAEGVILHTYDGGVWVLKQNHPDLFVSGPVIIEDNCLIGARAQILPNVRIGQNSIIGAGSVVISNVPPNSIVMGVPARVIGTTLKFEENCLAAWKEQKPPGYDKMSQKEKIKAKKKYFTIFFKDQIEK